MEPPAPTPQRSASTASSAFNRIEIAKSRVRKELDQCKKQQEEYASAFDAASKDLETFFNSILELDGLVLNYINTTPNLRFMMTNSNLFRDAGNEKSIVELKQMVDDSKDFTLENLLHPKNGLYDKYNAAYDQLDELFQNLSTTVTILTLIESRFGIMTLEELDAVECPDFLWAKNNFHPNHFDLNDSAIDLRREINKNLKIFKKRFSKLLSAIKCMKMDNSNTTTPSTSQNSAASENNVILTRSRSRGENRTLE